MIIALDLDGLFRDFLGSLFRQLEKDYPGIKLPEVKDLHTWDLENYIEKADGTQFTRDELSQYWGYDRVNEVYADADPFPGAIEWFKKIKEYCLEQGHKCIIITSASKDTVREANAKWLAKTGLDQVADEIYMQKDKYNVEGDILLDDYQRNLNEWVEVKASSFPGRRIAVAYDCPWNKEWKGPRVKSFSSFIEFLKTVDEFEKTQEKAV